MLRNKHVVIIGASGLIGQQVAEACRDSGAVVTAAGRRRDEGPEDTLALGTATVPFEAVDTNDPASVSALFEQCEKRFGPVNAVVNCAFQRNENFGAKLEDVAYNDFCDNVTRHLGGAFLICQKAIDYFTGKGAGNIVNFSSIYGVMAPRFEVYDGTEMTKEVEYIVCKSAIVQMTKYLAKYVKGRNIRVNCVSPGGVWNNQPDAFVENYNAHGLNKGMLDPGDVAGSVIFLLSDQSQYINGQNIVVDDGYSL